MKTSKIKNTDEAKNVLRIKDGKLFCADGQRVSTYLKNWAKETEIKENTPVNLMPRNLFIALCNVYVRFACDFCGRRADAVRKLIASENGVYICDECTNICAEIITEEKEKLDCQESNAG